jgi:hypothetical protein
MGAMICLGVVCDEKSEPSRKKKGRAGELTQLALSLAQPKAIGQSAPIDSAQLSWP